MSDITVTINPPNSTSVTIGNVVYPHGATHAAGGSDSLSGYYYPANNPSGYVTSGDFATTGYVADVSGAIVAQISSPANAVFTTGDQNISGAKNFYSRPTVNGTGVLLSGEASAQSTGYLTGYVSKLESGAFYPTSNPSGYITGVDLGLYATISYATGISGYLQGQISAINLSPLELATGNLDARVSFLEASTGIYVTGDVIRPSDTGNFYSITNPSGYITGVDLTNYVTGNVVRPSETGDFLTSSSLSPYFTISAATGMSGYLQSEIDAIDLSPLQVATGNLDTRVLAIESQTGSYVTGIVIRQGDTGVFYPTSNPSGFITGVDLSSYQTIIGSTGISGYLQTQVNSLNISTGDLDARVSDIEAQTGNFVLNGATGAFLTTGAADSRFYPLSSNPSSYLVAADISNLASTGYVTGVSGYLQGEINDLNSATGLLYPRSNPSGYITGVNLSAYALQGSVDAINNQSGQWITGYNKSITGLSFAGTDTKTLTLYSQDGLSLSANFSDLQGTGGAITGYVSLVGDENISGIKNFISRPTVNGSGVALSGEIYPTVREIYIDAGAMLTGVSGATPSTVSVSNSGIAYDCFNFDPATTGYAQFKLKLGDYNLGGIRARFDWTTSGTGGGVVWGVQGMAVNDSGSFSSAWGTPQESSDTFITGTGLHQTSGTSAVTLGGSPQPNSLLCFQIYRNVYNASDTLAVNANLLGIKLQYTGTSIQPW